MTLVVSVIVKLTQCVINVGNKCIYDCVILKLFIEHSLTEIEM